MSEYQHYEFMTSDRPLTREQLAAVNQLSSHIEASATHAVIEYHWGNFKHDPTEVLHKYFDGFLYWANWGTPRLALRFPHGALPANLLDGYDLEDFVTFTRHADYDILGIHFDEMEVIDALVGYELGALIPIRDELMAGDLRALYIVWLVAQDIMGNVEEEDYDIRVPALPPAFGTLTAAQQELADFLQAPPEILVAAARHSQTGQAATADDFAAWVELLPPEQCKDYLVRFAQGKPGLQRLLVKDLRELGQNKMKSEPATEEYVTFATLYTESKAISAELECKQREQEELARQCRLQDVHEHQDEHWRQIDLAATRSTGKGGYDEVVRLFVELRETAEYFHETPTFQACFSTWVQAHLRRPALITRLRDKDFTV